MGKQRELDDLRRQIQSLRATVSALRRHYKRTIGKEVTYSSSEADIRRIESICGDVPAYPKTAKYALNFYQKELDDTIARAQALKDDLHSKFPLTPCALYRLLKYDSEMKRKEERQRKRKRRRARRY